MYIHLFGIAKVPPLLHTGILSINRLVFISTVKFFFLGEVSSDTFCSSNDNIPPFGLF